MLRLVSDEDVHDDMLLVALGFAADEMKDQVLFIPL